MHPIDRNMVSLDTFTLLLCVGLLVVALAKYHYPSRFYTFLELPFNNKYISVFSKKGKLLNWFHLLFSVFQLIHISLFLYLSFKTFAVSGPFELLSSIMVFGLFLLVFLASKGLVQIAVGYVFDINGIVSDIIFNKQSYYNHSSFVIMTANIFLMYILPDSKTVIYVAIALFLLINFIGFVNVVRIHQNVFAGKIVYFILYLCTLEIAPLVIIGNYLKG